MKRSRARMLAVVLVLAACSGGSSEVRNTLGGPEDDIVACRPVGDVAGADRTVDVVLSEWTIEAPASVAAGNTSFATRNDGELPHELAVLRVGNRVDLPLTPEGGLDDEALGEGALLGEIEPFESNSTCTGAFDMTPGEYVLVCAIVEDGVGNGLSHWANGMIQGLTIT